MRLPFLDRLEELSRLESLLDRTEGSLGVLYGRRRLGKSRLLQQTLPPSRSVYYVGDERESALQRASVASEIGRRMPGFDKVTYPEWEALFSRWWEEAEPGSVLALDEFPALVSAAKEVPSLIQKNLDRHKAKGCHLLLTGSSQRMMQGLILDRAAPLFGRAHEILKINPLPAGWIQRAFHLRQGPQAVEAYAVWGGVPRYWELAADHPTLSSAIHSLVLSPLGVLHEEPRSLLLDDLRDTAQAASILSLIGRGCHRISEIAGRIGKPATSLSRPLQRLVELDLVKREIPFGTTVRDTKRTLYRIADPFLRFWFRFVEPNRSRLEVGQIGKVASEIESSFPHHVAWIWEELARASVTHMDLFGRRWGPAGRWWGTGLDRKQMEIDIVSESEDGGALLLAEASWLEDVDASALLRSLHRKAEIFPHLGKREVLFSLWLKSGRKRIQGAETITPPMVMRCLR
jgi:hypothetical protein